MRRFRRRVLIPLLAVPVFLLSACTSTAQPTVPSDILSIQASADASASASAHTLASATAQPAVRAKDCPKSLHCISAPAKLVNAPRTNPGYGTCNYLPLGKGREQWHASGIVEHTSEGSLESALNEIQGSQDPATCVSWNYTVGPDGTIYENVPPGNQVFAVGNRFLNADYISVENIGTAARCDITVAEYRASAKLAVYLSKRYGFEVTPSTVIGHDSVPGSNDDAQSKQHTDPGTCWDWSSFLKQSGAPAVHATPGSDVIQITVSSKKKNFVSLYTAPSTGAALLTDPYITGGTGKLDDWSDKAVYGHRYVVAGHHDGWTAIWYGGRKAWFRGGSQPVAARTATPKRASVPIYGRPLPSKAEFAASKLPAAVQADQDLPSQLTKYAMKRGQSYVLVSSSVKNQFFEGCDKTDCRGPFDGTVINGNEKYLEIEWNHRYVFVKASDVVIH